MSRSIAETLCPIGILHPSTQFISFVKSAIRIVGYISIPYSLPMAVSVLVASEVVGIIEELV